MNGSFAAIWSAHSRRCFVQSFPGRTVQSPTQPRSFKNYTFRCETLHRISSRGTIVGVLEQKQKKSTAGGIAPHLTYIMSSSLVLLHCCSASSHTSHALLVSQLCNLHNLPSLAFLPLLHILYRTILIRQILFSQHCA
jgi:hypothetical protein